MVIAIIFTIVVCCVMFGVFYTIEKELENEVKILNDYTARLFNHTVELAKIISEQKKRIESLEAQIKSMSTEGFEEYDF